MKKSFSVQSYEEMVKEIFRRTPSFGAVGQDAYKPGLERMRQLCGMLGDPQDKYPCIHIAGTNGKGSTSNMIAAHYASKGLKVGLYTSPHILDFRERIRIVGDELIPERDVWDFMQENGMSIDKLELSFFEITTAMAFWYFARKNVDLAVIEVGLGGRLDATNIITPILSVVTNIGLDHTNILGDTLEKIAGEKAGIIKPGVPVVLGEPEPEILPVFERVAREAGAPFFQAVRTPEHEQIIGDILPLLDLQGCYQEKNLNTVLSALETLGEKPSLEALVHTAGICGFHGRWERVSTSPEIICDIGHNEHGMKYNCTQLARLLESGIYDRLIMVYGSVSDKDVDAVLSLLPKHADIIFTAASNHRAMPAGELFSRAVKIRPEELCSMTAKVPDAVDKAIERSKAFSRPLIYIGGSTYVVSEAMSKLF